MFGFSIPKLVFLLIIIFIIWQIFRIIEYRNKYKNELKDNDKTNDESFESLEECEKCGNFFSIVKEKECPRCNKTNK